MNSNGKKERQKMAVIDSIIVDGINYDIDDTELHEQVDELAEDTDIATNAELIEALFS